MDGFEELTLELTEWCPSKCIHCSSTSGPEFNNHLSKDIAWRLVGEAAQIGAKKISFGGGEPTAISYFTDILRYVIELGMQAEIFTCGLLGTSGNLGSLDEDIVHQCRNLEGVKFIFSVHGADASVHDYVTQTPGSFELMIASMKNCLDNGIECEMNFVPMRVNTDSFEGLIELAENLGIRRVSVLRFVPQGRGTEHRNELELSYEEEDLFVEKMLYLRSRNDIEIRTGSPFNGIVPGNSVPCRAGFGKLVVQANGNVLPCEVFKHNKRCEWNLSVYEKSLTEILQSAEISVLRGLLQDRNCLECPVHRILRNDARRRVENGFLKAVTHS